MNRHIWKFILALPVVGLLVFGWVYWYEDTDTYRPNPPLHCSMAPGNRHPVRMIAFGDYGLGTNSQMELAHQMFLQYQKTPFKTALLLGDNIYPRGDVKTLGHDRFEVPYKPLLDEGVNFRAALGNHDTMKKAFMQDQIAYFHMPGDYYQFSEKDVDVFVLNTTHFIHGPEQRAWLEKALQQSHARWKIVIGHHPLYASGRHGSSVNLRKYLEPMLVKNHVDLYLSGHDHDYERIKPVKGVHYIVSGGGGANLNSFRKIAPESLVRISSHHFLLLEVGDKEVWAEAINRYGEAIDCTHWEKPRLAHI